MIVSFSWTTPALVSGHKTVTRRDWSAAHAAHFKAGMLVDAWDRSPRTRMGRKVATIRITREPWRQRSDFTMFPDDWSREGFVWLQQHGTEEDRSRVVAIWTGWHTAPRDLYVVEFTLVDRFCQCGAKIVDGRGGVMSDSIAGTQADAARQEWRCCPACAFEPTGCRCRFEQLVEVVAAVAPYSTSPADPSDPREEPDGRPEPSQPNRTRDGS